MKEPETQFTRAIGEFKATAGRERGAVICEAAAAQALHDALGEPSAGEPLPPLDQERSERILEVLAPFLDTGDSRSAPGWAVEIYRLLTLEPAPVPAVGARFECVCEGLTGSAPSPVTGTGQHAISDRPSQAGHGTARTIARNSRGKVHSMCRQVTNEEMRLLAGYEGATLGLWRPSEIAGETLGAEPAPETLFAYCYRRFGPPLCPSDPDKELASYLLTTPMAGVLLVVSIRAPGCSAGSFGYLVEGEIFWSALREYEAATLARRTAFDRWLAKRDAAPAAGEEARAAAWREFDTHHPRRDHAHHRGLLGKVHRALRASIKDLARPTSVRDSYFNALGPVDEGDVRAPVAPFDTDAAMGGSA